MQVCLLCLLLSCWSSACPLLSVKHSKLLLLPRWKKHKVLLLFFPKDIFTPSFKTNNKTQTLFWTVGLTTTSIYNNHDILKWHTDIEYCVKITHMIILSKKYSASSTIFIPSFFSFIKFLGGWCTFIVVATNHKTEKFIKCNFPLCTVVGNFFST